MNPFYVKWPLFVEKYIYLERFLTKWFCNNCVSSKIKIYIFPPINFYILFLNELHNFTIITVFTTVHNYVLWQDIVWSFQRVKMPNKISSACIIVQCKVIIKKSRREASSVEQYTIDCDHLAYLKFKTKF